MRRRRHHEGRHPFFENLVFGLAGLLAMILFYLGGAALLRARSGSGVERPAYDSQAETRQLRPVKQELDVGPTERGVGRAAPVKAAKPKPGRRNAKKTVVPSPR